MPQEDLDSADYVSDKNSDKESAKVKDSETEVANKILEPREEFAQKQAHRHGESVALNVLTVLAIIIGLVLLVCLAFYLGANGLPSLPIK